MGEHTGAGISVIHRSINQSISQQKVIVVDSSLCTHTKNISKDIPRFQFIGNKQSQNCNGSHIAAVQVKKLCINFPSPNRFALFYFSIVDPFLALPLFLFVCVCLNRFNPAAAQSLLESPPLENRGTIFFPLNSLFLLFGCQDNFYHLILQFF